MEATTSPRTQPDRRNIVIVVLAIALVVAIGFALANRSSDDSGGSTDAWLCDGMALEDGTPLHVFDLWTQAQDDQLRSLLGDTADQLRFMDNDDIDAARDDVLDRCNALGH